MHAKLLLFALVAVLLVRSPGPAEASMHPTLQGSVSDPGDMLTSTQETDLTRRLNRYRVLSGRDIIVVTTKSALKAATAKVHFDLWSVTRPSLANGLAIYIENSGSISVLTGVDLRPSLPRTLIAELTKPLDNPADPNAVGLAVVDKLDGITGYLEGVPTQERRPVPIWIARWLTLIFFSSMLVIPWVSSMMTRSMTLPGGLYAAIMETLLMAAIAGPIVGAIVLALIAPTGFLLDRLISGHYQRSRDNDSRPAWWAGGLRF